jgi:hypothetical protein
VATPSATAGSIRAPELPVWVVVAAATVAMSVAMAAVMWAATHVHPDPVLRDAALFVHLACLVLGFGSVLAVDWVACLWLAQRRTLADLVRTAGNAHLPIWVGYAGLVASGMLLEPDLTSRVTVLKLGLVLVIGWNGLLAGVLRRRLSHLREQPGHELLTAAAVVGAVSQLGWWGAMVIGFLNAR